MLILHVNAERMDRDQILDCFNLNKVLFIDNSCPDDVHEYKHYVFEGSNPAIKKAIDKLRPLTGDQLCWALFTVGAMPVMLLTSACEFRTVA